MAPQFAQFEREYGSKFPIVEIDTDNEDSPEFKTYIKYKRSDYIPESVIIRDGRLVYVKVGMMDAPEMEKAVDDIAAGKAVPSDLK